MLKWVILGMVVALVAHWSSKEVHADSPLTDGEKDLLVKLKETLDGSNDQARRDDSVSCDDLCLDVDDQEACFAACNDDDRREVDSCEVYCEDADDSEDFDQCMVMCKSTQKRMFDLAEAQEENQERALGSDKKLSIQKKFWRRDPWRAPRIPPWRAPRIPPWRAPRIPPWRAPRLPRILPWRAPRIPPWRFRFPGKK